MHKLNKYFLKQVKISSEKKMKINSFILFSLASASSDCCCGRLKVYINRHSKYNAMCEFNQIGKQVKYFPRPYFGFSK